MVAAPGAVASTVTASGADAALALNPAAVATTVKLCDVSLSTPVVNVQVTAPVAVTVPRDVAPSNISTDALATAVPVKVSVVSLVMPSPPAPVSVL